MLAETCPFCGAEPVSDSTGRDAWCPNGHTSSMSPEEWNRRRAAHQERDADARRLDWMRDHYARFVYETTEIVDGRAVNLRTRIEWTVFGDGEPRTMRTVKRTFTGDFRAAIDAAMAADTQTEGVDTR